MAKKALVERGSSRSASRSPGKEDSTFAVKTQTAFVGKLYTMVEDPCIQNLISWSKTGNTFLVHEPTDFSKKVLPIYFKHNNWQSFVRQLNMYGFHKVNNVFHTNSPIDGQPWEFEHTDFRKGAKELLSNIKRKAPKSNIATQPIPTEVSPAQPKQTRAVTPEVTVETDPRDEVIEQLTLKVSRLEESLERMHSSHEYLLSEMSSYKSAQEKSFCLIARMADMLQSLAKDDYDDWQAYRKRKIDAISSINHELAHLIDSEASNSLTTSPQRESVTVVNPSARRTSDFIINQANTQQSYPEVNRESRRFTPPFYPSNNNSYNHSYLPSMQTTPNYPLSPSSNPRDGKSSSPVFPPCTNITLPPLAEMTSNGIYDMSTRKRPRLA